MFGLAWSPDGRRIASGGGELNVNQEVHNHAVQVWDVASEQRLFTYTGHSDAVLTLKWSPDGTRITTGSADKTVQAWNATTGQPLITYRNHTAEVLDLSWSPDGKRIVSGGNDQTVQVWDAATGATIFTYPNPPRLVLTVTWSHDGTRIASSYRGTQSDAIVEIRNSSNGNLLCTYLGHAKSLQAFSPLPHRTLFASQETGDASLALFREQLLLSGSGTGVYAVAWSPNDIHIASAGGAGDFTIQVWNTSGGKLLLTYRGHSTYINDAEWSSDGKRVASGSDDATVQVWQAV